MWESVLFAPQPRPSPRRKTKKSQRDHLSVIALALGSGDYVLMIVSFLHHGQKRGNCFSTVSGWILTFVRCPHLGQIK
jgi:hypothetical protein